MPILEKNAKLLLLNKIEMEDLTKNGSVRVILSGTTSVVVNQQGKILSGNNPTFLVGKTYALGSW